MQSLSPVTRPMAGVLLLLGLAWPLCAAQREACAATVAKTVKVLVESSMMHGQWVTKVELRLAPENSAETGQVVLHLEQKSGECNGVAMSRMQVDITEPVPEGYQLIPEVGYYKFHRTPMTWVDGSRACDREGGHLAILNSDREAAALKDLFHAQKNLEGVYDNRTAFIGFHDRLVEGQYITVLGDTLESTGFVKWSQYYLSPDNFRGDDLHPGEDCGSIFWDDGFLNDAACDERNAFICEKELPSSELIENNCIPSSM